MSVDTHTQANIFNSTSIRWSMCSRWSWTSSSAAAGLEHSCSKSWKNGRRNGTSPGSVPLPRQDAPMPTDSTRTTDSSTERTRSGFSRNSSSLIIRDSWITARERVPWQSPRLFLEEAGKWDHDAFIGHPGRRVIHVDQDNGRRTSSTFKPSCLRFSVPIHRAGWETHRAVRHVNGGGLGIVVQVTSSICAPI